MFTSVYKVSLLNTGIVSGHQQSKRRSRRVMADMTSPDPVDAARRRLRRITGATPATAAAAGMLREAAELERSSRLQVDALIVLARAGGATWQTIAAAIGSTRQGALQRHGRAARRLELVGG